MRILLIGGGKSGKSTMAQRLAAALSGDMPRYYWATMTPHDDEDLARIRRHVADRAGMDFITVERSFDLPAALPALDRHGTVLFDSVTACLSEQMFPGPAPDAGAANRVLRELLRTAEQPAAVAKSCPATRTTPICRRRSALSGADKPAFFAGRSPAIFF